MKMAQYGTAHGHAAGKMQSLRTNPHVEVAGVYEPDPDRRAAAQNQEPFADLHWFESEAQLLEEDEIVAVAAEGSNDESLEQARRLISAGKHVWYDKPAGNNWQLWQEVVASAKEHQLQIQSGYMFRYHPGFCRIADWTHSHFLGDLFSLRAHMSTNVAVKDRERMSQFEGGVLFDLCGHVLDQVLWLVGERPKSVTTFLRNDSGQVPGFKDNTLAVFEFERALAFIDIAAMETPPMARRFEVYGSRGSAIMEPLEPSGRIRLCLDEERGGFLRGEHVVTVDEKSRQDLYDLELSAFLEAIEGRRQADRSYEFELLVQETLLRVAGELIDT